MAAETDKPSVVEKPVRKRAPRQAPPVRVDMVWHRRTQMQAAQRWLRDAVSAAAQSVTPAA